MRAEAFVICPTSKGALRTTRTPRAWAWQTSAGSMTCVKAAAVVMVLKSRLDQFPVKNAKTSRAGPFVESGWHNEASTQLQAPAPAAAGTRAHTSAAAAILTGILGLDILVV